jgi:hypothetical protein
MIRTVAAIAAVVVLVAACSSNDDKGTPAPTTAPRSTPAKLPVAKAADGNNLKACTDAVCEVYVKTGTRIPVKSSIFGFSTLVVTKVSAKGVDFGAKSTCCMVSATQQQPGKTVRLNKMNITTVTITKTTAILRLKPA